MKKRILAIILAAVTLMTVGCNSKSVDSMKNQAVAGDKYACDVEGYTEKAFADEAPNCPAPIYGEIGEYNTAEYKDIEESGFKSVLASPFSTFSADVDTASYSMVRNYIENGWDIQEDMVRSEEMINYFRYDYQQPTGDVPFSVTTELSDCPWNSETKLLQIGLQAKDIDYSEMPNSNLVFLLDVSGSMDQPNKLPLLQKAFKMLAENLRKEDKVSIVVYAGNDAVLLDGASGNEKEEIISVIDRLEANGSTAGSRGIETAYKLAKENFIKNGVNRVILATDGDMNIGITSEGQLKKLIESKRDDGIYLTVLGFGNDNLKDNKLVSLADNGNGSYHFIDSVNEAKKVLVDQMGGTMFTVAKDVKFQLEFNPAYVRGYRLIGYEKRALADEDFTDDSKDAGEMGAGHSVTALYELVTVDSEMKLGEPERKYCYVGEDGENLSGTPKDFNITSDSEAELLTISLRYKNPDSSESKLLTYPISASLYNAEMSERMRFVSAVAGFSLELRNSKNYNEPLTADFYNSLEETELVKGDFLKQEFLELVRKYNESITIED